MKVLIKTPPQRGMQCKKELTEFWVDMPSFRWCEVCGNVPDPARRAAAADEWLWNLAA